MRSVFTTLLLALTAVVVVAVGAAAQSTSPETLQSSAQAMFAPLPEVVDNPENPVTEAKVELGKMLYYDPRLSLSGFISCNSCHNLATYGVDNLPTSLGHRWAVGPRNSPTVLNAALHATQFWDGRAADVEEQAKGPILNPVEMAMKDEEAVLATLRSMPGYVDAFKKAFPDDEDPISYDNMAIAIGAFERTLVTPSRWDAYLEGDGSALTEAEVEGAKLFVSSGCITCHAGPLLGGQMYQKLGLVKPYDNPDLGRFTVTQAESDRQVFKVPSLRNIAKTAPYFHDGHVATLPEAVSLMATHQLGRDLSDEDTAKIVTFLEALTGELPKDRIQTPDLPESTDTTPAADPA